jgi:hypothetical protein
MLRRSCLLALIGIGLLAATAQGDICGDQGKDNRPNHCEILVDETWVHQMSRCKVLEPGKCQYTHCSGSTQVYNEADCCCLESQTCPGAKYVGLCVGANSMELSAEVIVTASATSNAPEENPARGKRIELPTQKKLSPAVQLRENNTAAEVQMWCQVTDGGHRLQVTYTNSGAQKKCTSRCYYKDDKGNSGVLKCEGGLQSKVTKPSLFCDSLDSERSYTVTDPGSFSCS